MADEKPKASDPEQLKRFIDTARGPGVDEDPETFERAFTRVVHSSDPHRERRPGASKN